MRGLAARVRSLWRGLRRPEQLSAEMEEEMRFHIEMEAERLVRERGLEPEEARRQAAVAFGGVEKYKEKGRDVRGITAVTGMSLDFRLGWRMLWKHPGLTLVGGLAIAFAIWVGVGTFEFIFQVVRPTLPFPQGDGVVSIRSWNAASSDFERARLDDFVRWRGELRSVEGLGAYRTLRRNLITTDGRSEPVAVADISASAFPITGEPPLLGRTLTAADERADTPPWWSSATMYGRAASCVTRGWWAASSTLVANPSRWWA